MAFPLHCNLQSRPFTIERPALRSRRSHVLLCRARSASKTVDFGRAAGGVSSLALYLASIPRAWAEADIELSPQLTSPTSAPQLPDVNIQLPKDIQLPTDAGGIGQFISDYPLLLPLAAALVLIPLAFSQASRGSGLQGVSAARALSVLETEDPVVFLDIRSASDAKIQGSPDLSSIRKAAIRLPFTKVAMQHHTDTTYSCNLTCPLSRFAVLKKLLKLLCLQAVKDEVVQDDSFLQKFGKLRQITEGVTVVLLDRYVSMSAMQAEHAAYSTDINAPVAPQIL